MASLLLDVEAEVEPAQPEQMTLSLERLMYCEKRYDGLIEACLVADPPSASPPAKIRGRKNKRQSPAKQLLNRQCEHQREVLAFRYGIPIPFANHLADRDVRMVKVKGEISGAFRPRTRDETLCAIPSYRSTVRKHDVSMFMMPFTMLLLAISSCLGKWRAA